MTMFRAVWPIIDEATPVGSLIDQASDDVPALARRAKVTLTGPGSYRVADSTTVPGSGRITSTMA